VTRGTKVAVRARATIHARGSSRGRRSLFAVRSRVLSVRLWKEGAHSYGIGS